MTEPSFPEQLMARMETESNGTFVLVRKDPLFETREQLQAFLDGISQIARDKILDVGVGYHGETHIVVVWEPGPESR